MRGNSRLNGLARVERSSNNVRRKLGRGVGGVSHEGLLKSKNSVMSIWLCVPGSKTGDPKSKFDQLENGGKVGRGVRDIIFPRKRGDHDQRDAIAGVHKIAGRPRGGGAEVPRHQIFGLDAIRAHGCKGRNVIIEAPALVEGQDESRVRPRRTGHQSVDQGGYVTGPELNVNGKLVGVGRMLVEAGVAGGFELNHLDFIARDSRAPEQKRRLRSGNRRGEGKGVARR